MSGDMIVARLEDPTQEADCCPEEQAKKDIVRVCVLGKHLLQGNGVAEHIANFEKVKQRFLGPRAERSSGPPDEKGIGGTKFERTKGVRHNKQGKRCYATTTTIQTIKGGLFQPGANSLCAPKDDPTLLKDLNYVSSILSHPCNMLTNMYKP